MMRAGASPLQKEMVGLQGLDLHQDPEGSPQHRHDHREPWHRTTSQRLQKVKPLLGNGSDVERGQLALTQMELCHGRLG